MPTSLNNFSFGVANNFLRVYDNTYQVTDDFSKVMGTHTLRFGGIYSYDQVTYKFTLNLNGSFGFSGTETGNDFADFLLGAPDSYSQGLQLPLYSRARYYAIYGQDSWRATRNLTLNYGLRWEVSSPWWEAHNQIEAMDTSCQSVVFPGAPKGWCFPGDPGPNGAIPSTLSHTHYNNFAPRLGIAYSPSGQSGFLGKLTGGPGQMSIRASFGIFYTSFENRSLTQETGDAPFGYWWQNPALPTFETPFVDRPSGLDRGQRFPVPIPPLDAGPNNPDNSIDWSQFLPISSSPAMHLDNRLPYAEHYNLTIQRQFGSATILSVAYLGTQGHRLLANVEANTGNPALCLSVSQLNQVTDGVTCGPNGENGIYHPVTGGVITTTRYPFSDAFGSNGWMATWGNSNYHALQASLRRTIGQVEFLASYTWSKSIDNASGNGLGQGDNLNPIGYGITRGLSAFDVKHNFVVSYSWRLPFDKLGRPNRLTSGWTFNGITRFATGFPVYLRENDDRSLLGTFGTGQGNQIDVPNRNLGDLNITDPRKSDPASQTNPYFNTSLFSKETLGQLGNSSRRFFHGPGWNNWDLALAKDLRLTESKVLQFRAELFNGFNHAQFNSPSGNILSSTFGFVTSAKAARIGQVGIKFNF
ncbi:MAG TPA: TonB-dependent receptor [Terriglobia bacterium]|nr:TonB-dependent receptor [Terriglobia bacterium]